MNIHKACLTLAGLAYISGIWKSSDPDPDQDSVFSKGSETGFLKGRIRFLWRIGNVRDVSVGSDPVNLRIYKIVAQYTLHKCERNKALSLKMGSNLKLK